MGITPKAVPEGTMAADISVRLVGLRPNATYLFQRAQEGVGGRALGMDGICQRGLGLSPWSPSDPPTVNFQTIPLPATGPLITITTAATGDGAIDFEFRTLMVLAGTTNDVMFRLVDNDAAPTTELRSACMTITCGCRSTRPTPRGECRPKPRSSREQTLERRPRRFGRCRK